MRWITVLIDGPRRHHREEVGDEDVGPDEDSIREKSLPFGGRVNMGDGYVYNDAFD